MFFKVLFHQLVPHSHQHYLHTLSSGKLHSRYEIAVCGYKNELFDNRFASKPSNVETYFHIHTFLFEVRSKVAIC